MNKSLGLFLGLLTGIVLLFAVGRQIYTGGYLTTQTSAENEPGVLGYINQIRQDMTGSGWDQLFAAVDKTPERFYRVADILGLLYHNPLIHGRASVYPPFLGLSEKQEFQDIGADQDLLKDLTQGGSLMSITGNPKVKAVMNNQELTQELLATDLEDFKTFLETGKSPKYESERILGRWRLDAPATLYYAKRTRQNVTAAEIAGLRYALSNFLASATLTAYTDGKLVIAVPPPPAPATNAVVDPNAPVTPVVDPIMARYGPRPGGFPGAATPPPVVAPRPKTFAQTNVFATANLSGEGTWKRSADAYLLTSTGLTGKEESVTATITDSGRLIVPVPALKIGMYFIRML